MQTNRNQASGQSNQGGRRKVDSVEQNQQGQQYSNGKDQDRKEVRDISDIDQQEGNMNNGTLGGNFDNTNSDTDNDPDRDA